MNNNPCNETNKEKLLGYYAVEKSKTNKLIFFLIFSLIALESLSVYFMEKNLTSTECTIIFALIVLLIARLSLLRYRIDNNFFGNNESEVRWIAEFAQKK